MHLRYTVYTLLLFLLLTNSVNAVDIQVKDINTKVNLENVLISVYNPDSNLLNSSLTDANGLLSLYLNETPYNYTVTYAKLGYHTKISEMLNQTTVVYQTLNPISDDGIINIVFGDMLLNTNRRFCVYYDNGRLEGCYYLNDTVTLLVNEKYLVIPKTELTDTLSSIDNLKNNTKNIAFIVITLFLIVVLFMALYGKFVKSGGRRRRR